MEEPTVRIPPVQAPPPMADPFAAPPAAKKKGQIPAGLLAIPIVFALLAAGCAVFLGIRMFQYKSGLAAEQSQRLAAEQREADVQADLDKLQSDYDKSSTQLEDAQRQLEDARGQLDDVSGQLSDGSSRLEAAEGELAELIDLLSAGYGFGSRDYYASQGVVVVSQYGSKSVNIYENVPGATFTFHTPGYGFGCQWVGDSFIDGRNSVSISGSTPGYYTLSFTNDYNSDAFDILVIVTE